MQTLIGSPTAMGSLVRHLRRQHGLTQREGDGRLGRTERCSSYGRSETQTRKSELASKLRRSQLEKRCWIVSPATVRSAS